MAEKENRLTRNKVMVLIAIIVGVQAVFAVLMGVGYHVLDRTISTNFSKSTESDFLLKSNAYELMSRQRPVTDAFNSVVYFPELKIKLPAYALTKSLAYSTRTESKDGIDPNIDSFTDTDKSPTATEADVTSTWYLPPDKMTVMDCSELVRIKLEDKPHPYNPHEKATSVKLADGRTLQVYEFVNYKECQTSWTQSVTPAQVAEAFKEAQSY